MLYVNEIQKGLVVKSQAGKDKGYFFVVVEVEGKYAMLCDGKIHPLSCPKKKNFKHLAVTNTILSCGEYDKNRMLKKSLSRFK